jgi:uncharacterized small protein (DUF1192 family)
MGDLDDVGVEPLVNDLKIDAEIAGKLIAAIPKEIERLDAESKKKEIERLDAESKKKEIEKQLSQETKESENKT